MLGDACRSDSCGLLAGLAPEVLSDLAPAVECLPIGSELVVPADPSPRVRILLQGWATRHKTLNDGRRQITGFMFAEDMGSSWTPADGYIDHGARTLTACRMLSVHGERLADLARRTPVIGTRVRRANLADFAILNAWLVNLGQRKAPERIAHLLCELSYRLRLTRSGAGPAHNFLPLAQQDIADALGLTSVHVNRVVQRLRANGFIEVRKGALILRDPAGLAKLCDFDATYLSGVIPYGGDAQPLTGTGR